LWRHEAHPQELCVRHQVEHRQPHPDGRRRHLQGREVRI
jgi:hypothetical protein